MDGAAASDHTVLQSAGSGLTSLGRIISGELTLKPADEARGSQ